MADPRPASLWHVLSATVVGSAHVRAGTVNQDRVASLQLKPRELPAVLALADGHGSARCFRSDRGARFAVEAATEVVRAALATIAPDDGAGFSLQTQAAERWPRLIVDNWVARVRRDLESTPLTTAELEPVARKYGEPAAENLRAHPEHAYGATLLIAAVTDRGIAYLQLGDGDILATTEAGVVERPLPGDSRLFGNETTSISGREAWNDFRVSVSRPGVEFPRIIMLSTDGYSNSFRDDSAFMRTGSDYLALLKSEGVEYVQQHLEEWLRETSNDGSGDDTSLVMLFRADSPREALVDEAIDITAALSEDDDFPLVPEAPTATELTPSQVRIDSDIAELKVDDAGKHVSSPAAPSGPSSESPTEKEIPRTGRPPGPPVALTPAITLPVPSPEVPQSDGGTAGESKTGLGALLRRVLPLDRN
jgi:hypothetical protein